MYAYITVQDVFFVVSQNTNSLDFLPQKGYPDLVLRKDYRRIQTFFSNNQKLPKIIKTLSSVLFTFELCH